MEPKYKRVIIKISGEALAAQDGMGINEDFVKEIAEGIRKVHEKDVEVAIVVGGGNFWRGKNSSEMDRSTSDHMGMLATVINSLALQDAIESCGIEVRVLSAIEMRQIAETYVRRRAVRHLEKKRVVIFACGTGNPFFSTDTAVALRGAEIDTEAILMAKNIDGVYESDPKENPDAQKYNRLTHTDIINKDLKVMDATSATLCRENNIPIIVFGVDEPENIYKVIMGAEDIGTIIK